MSKFNKFAAKDLKKLLLSDLKALATQFSCDSSVLKLKKSKIIEFLVSHDAVGGTTNTSTSTTTHSRCEKPAAVSETWPDHHIDIAGVESAIPVISYSSIYEYCTRISGTTKSSFKSFDRAMKHIDAGDVHNVKFLKVSSSM